MSCSYYSGIAQTGPGGVGNSANNVLWLNSESIPSSGTNRINYWPDESGNANHAFGQMIHAPNIEQTTTWPERSALFSAESPAYLSIADHPSLDGMSALTMFAVIKPSDTFGEKSIISKRDGNGGNNEIFAYRLLSKQNGAVAAEVRRIQNRLTASENLSTSEYNIVAFRFDGNTNNRQLKIFKNGRERGRGNTPQTSIVPDVDSDLIIGAINANGELPFRGQIAEVIIYNTALNDAEMVILENYLSAKYQIPSESYYSEGLSDYRQDVSGIGRATGQNRHYDSQGRSALRVTAAGNLGGRQYVFWGHNGAPSGQITTDNLPSGIEARLKRTWKFVQERGVNTVHIGFHLDSLAGNDPVALRLLVAANGQNFLDQTLAFPGVVNGDYIEFRNVPITDGQLVTIGTSNAGIAPLPVKLLHFNVENQPEVVALTWATASETNNDYFTVLRSTDPTSDWETIFTEVGAGNSGSRLAYHGYDKNPLPGVSYYRLAQTDFDGKNEQFEIKSINRPFEPQNIGLELFPNPSADMVYIYSDISLEGVRTVVYDMQGGEAKVNIVQNDTHARIDVSELQHGVYILRCAFETGMKSLPFVVAP